MTRVVIWPGCGPLYLNNVKRNDDGSIKSGWVVNGAWDYELRDGECLAKAGTRIVNHWPAPQEIPCVEVPSSVRGGYESVIAWAEKQLQAGDTPQLQHQPPANHG